MITKDKITEIFCILDEFSKNFDAEMQHHSLPTGSPKARRRRKASLSDSEIMTILLVFHFGTFALSFTQDCLEKSTFLLQTFGLMTFSYITMNIRAITEAKMS